MFCRAIVLLVLFLGFVQKDLMSSVHKAHLSSSWYSQDKAKLDAELKNYFSLAKKHLSIQADPTKIKALIVPHAGHYFSGLCAASAYQAIKENNKIRKVVILAPSHSYTFNGVALPDYDTYRTVLGDISVDKKSIDRLQKNRLFSVNSKAHALEHSLEIELPFLQHSVKNFSIIPLIVGQVKDSDYEKISSALSKIIDSKTLIVVSSDFVHYGERFSYTPFKKDVFANIRRTDSRVIGAIENKSFSEFGSVLKETGATICGRSAIKILLKLIEKGVLGDVESRLSSYYLSPQLQNARSNKTINISKLFSSAPDSSVSDMEAKNSVSYAGLIFTQEKRESQPKEARLTGHEKRALLQLARDSIKSELPSYPVISSGLKQVAGAFVTLNKKTGALRGCIGRIITSQPLYKTVVQMARAAAFHDSRFSPVKKEELDDLIIDITVLTPPKRVASYNDIKLGKHGIILKKGFKRSVFLPQVPGTFGWDLTKTLEQLALKAYLKRDEWKNSTYEVFEGFEFKE